MMMSLIEVMGLKRNECLEQHFEKEERPEN